MNEEICNTAEAAQAAEGSRVDRRRRNDRRTMTLRTFVRSGLTPRRRNGRRETENQSLVDWHEPQLLFLSIMILLLSVTDAFFTLTLLTIGAQEANPVLAYVLGEHPEWFAAVKMSLTGLGVTVLVALGRARVFSRVPVRAIIHACLLCYVALIGYEWWMLGQLL